MFNSLTYGILNIIVYTNTHISNNYISIYLNRYDFQGQEHDEEVLDYVYEYTEWESVETIRNGITSTTTNYLSFDGNDRITCGTNDRNLTNAVTVEAWVNTTSNSSTTQMLVSKYTSPEGFNLFMLDGKAAISGRNGNDNTYKESGFSSFIADGEWHHVVGTADENDTWRIYVDGVLENEGDFNLANPSLENAINLHIGGWQYSNYRYTGDIKEVSVWNKAKTASEIYYDYKKETLNGSEANLVAYFPLNEGSGTTATDLSPTGINGSITGATWQSETIIDTNLIGLDSIRVPNRASVNYKYRVTDTRLGRFFVIDPLHFKYPWNSNYAFSENKVIAYYELEGAEAKSVVTKNSDGSTSTKVMVEADAYNNSMRMTNITMNLVLSKATAILNQFNNLDDKVEFKTEIFDKGSSLISNGGRGFKVFFEDMSNLKYKGQDVPGGTLGFAQEGIGNPVNNFKILALGNSEQDVISMARTLAHEIGHGLGLAHPDFEDANVDGAGNIIIASKVAVVNASESPSNLMRQTKRTDGTILEKKQLNEVIKIINSNGNQTTLNPPHFTQSEQKESKAKEKWESATNWSEGTIPGL